MPNNKKKSERDLEGFWQKVRTHFFEEEHSELDYGEFLDLGEDAGLLRQEKYNPKTHGDELLGEPAPGDMVYIEVKP